MAAKTKASAGEITDALFEALRKRYGPKSSQIPEWAFIEQVRSDTWGRRTADAVALNLWKSRGQVLHGFEVKATRVDWLKELKQPDKADLIGAYCDYWWVVTVPEVVKDGELPDGWGLLYLRGKRLMASKEPTKKEAEPFDRVFVVELIRRLYQVQGVVSLLEKAEQTGFEKGRLRAEERVGAALAQSRELQDKIRDFEQAAGVPMSFFKRGAEDTGRAVRMVLQGDSEIKRLEDRLRGLKKTTEGIALDIDQRLTSADLSMETRNLNGR